MHIYPEPKQYIKNKKQKLNCASVWSKVSSMVIELLTFQETVLLTIIDVCLFFVIYIHTITFVACKTNLNFLFI